MKQILKKNQIIISVIAIMLIAAGYMNYTSNEKQALETAVLTDSENLIKNKGFQDLIIFINGDSISIIVKAKELKEEQIAQIQNIISRELKGEIENIHISNKE